MNLMQNLSDREIAQSDRQLPSIPPMSMVTAMSLINQNRSGEEVRNPNPGQQNQQQIPSSSNSSGMLPRISNMPGLTGNISDNSQ
jgi:hypothetical protein